MAEQAEAGTDGGTAWPGTVVLGAGAVGCYFGGMLARAGAPVALVGRPGPPSAHMRALAERGLRIEGTAVRETLPVRVAALEEVVPGADLVLVAVKTLDTVAAAESLAPLLGLDTTVVSLQNGIENVEWLRQAGVAAIAAVVYVAAAIESPGVVTHRGRGDLVIGDSQHAGEVGRVAAWFEAAGVPCAATDRIREKLWTKLILNSMANGTSALTGASYRRLAAFEPTWKLALDVAREGVAVAAAEGTALDLEEIVAAGEGVVTSVGDATSSTQQDIARGRLTEIDSLNGVIARKGAELGVSTPVNEVVHALVKLREQVDSRG